MYDCIRQQALGRCDWKGGKDGTLTLQYIEAWRYPGDVRVDGSNFFTGTLSSEAELHAWLARQHAPGRQQGTDKPTSCIKLLACDRAQYVPLDFALSRQAFDAIETAFSLSPLTVSSMESEPGTHSRFLVYAEDDSSKLERIQTILKAPQKREIFNWGLALTTHVQSSTTTGFLYGTGMSPHSANPKHNRYQECGQSPYECLINSLRDSFSLWQYPLFLPCLFLSEHLACINAFSTRGSVITETFHIEHALGVVKVGQSAYLNKRNGALQSPNSTEAGYHVQKMGTVQQPPSSSAQAPSRKEMEELTVRINTQSTRVLFTARSPEWNLACARFILQVMHEVGPFLANNQRSGHIECKQLLEHNLTIAEAIASNIAGMKERMALQLDVLYNFVAQLDNQTSAELAASASRDSTSMKILAFISALFLPGSFVSALFSMNMFDWSGERDVVSDKFYIYWAAALPLTAVTVLGWAAWWYFELGRFDMKIKSIRARPKGNLAGKQGP